MTDLDPARSVAAFDSATALHAAVAAGLRGSNFPHLGQSPMKAAAVRAAGHLPWPLLRRLYTRMGAAEGVRPHQLGEIDLGAVAGWLADQLPRRPYPAVMIGSSNGALAQLATAMQIPWLPGTVLVPVKRTGDPQRPVDALRFGERVAPDLLKRNPDITLHQMHDQIQDELMIAKMAYFRVKWNRLPSAYAGFLHRNLAPGAPVILVEDTSDWPVVRVSDRHVFQSGAQGGLLPETYLSRAHTPTPDDRAPEAEWGADPGLGVAVAEWCEAHGHPLVRLVYSGPQTVAQPVATLMREWYARRGERTDRLVVSSFVLGDPWRMINTASVPYWTFFSVQPALGALDEFLASSAPFRDVHLLLFQHGVESDGIARPEEWARVVCRHGGTPHFLGLDLAKFPHDIGFLGRYGRALAELSPATELWQPLPPEETITELQRSLKD